MGILIQVIFEDSFPGEPYKRVMKEEAGEESEQSCGFCKKVSPQPDPQGALENDDMNCSS